jgi:pyruvate dehydrogenase E2 component (dihydrolipoamide acetyltransferase)
VPAFSAETRVEPATAAPQKPGPKPTDAPGDAGVPRKAASPAARRRAKELGIDWREIEREDGGPILVKHVQQADDGQKTAERIQASPVARRAAESSGIDLGKLAAEKPGQRIVLADVEAATAARAEAQAEAEEAADEAAAAPGLAPKVRESHPITHVRRLIAERMLRSSQTTAPLTLTTEADATELVELRERLKAALEPEGELVPTYNDLLVKLTGVALQRHPGLNAYWEEDTIQLLEDIHIGVAVDTETGLVVPVIRNVTTKSIHQIAEEAQALAKDARSRRLSPDSLQGGTFTVTNLGMYGIDAFTPIINLPECAILGVGRIVSKPAVHNGEITPRHRMALNLTFDHRVVDGAPAARFLNTVREFVERPHLWLAR